MRFDLARHPAFPYRQLCRTLLWISILAAAVAIVSCTTLEATGQIVAPTITWIPTASPLPSRTANPTFTDSIPAPEASPIAHAERMATDISFPQADQIPSTTVPLATSAPTETPTAEAAPVYTFRVLDAFPHDPEAFTQGLVLEDDVFYEGTGLWGQSTLRRVDPETGVDDLDRFPRVGLATKHHRSQAELGDLQIRIAKTDVFHLSSPVLPAMARRRLGVGLWGSEACLLGGFPLCGDSHSWCLL